MNRNDINSNNTKLLIAEVYKNLIEHNTSESISISTIVKMANINRNTFYYHFSNIKELILWIMHNDMYGRLAEFETTNDGQRIRSFVIDYLSKNRVFLNNSFLYLGFDDFHQSYVTELTSVIGEYIDAISIEKNIMASPEYKAFLTDLYSEMVSLLFIRQFRKNRFQNDGEDTIKGLKIIFDVLIPDSLLQNEFVW